MLPNVIAITGAAGALGSAVAHHLVARGARVALLDLPRAAARLDALAAGLGPSACAHASALDTREAWADALAAVRGALGELPTGGVLVAGGWAGGAKLHEAADDAAYDGMIATNTDSAYRALAALLPGMVAARRGSVVVIGSRAAVRPWTSAGAAAYAASKAAVVALAEAAAAEVLEAGVRVNAVLPSTMDTPANRAAMPEADPTRWVSLASVAGVVGFLLSDDARDVSGAALPVYGRA